jgi:hypothetical protein
MELRKMDEAIVIMDENLGLAGVFRQGLWAPAEPHAHGAFVPLNAPVSNLAILGALSTSPAIDYSQWLMTISGRIDALNSEVAAISAKLSQALERAQGQPAAKLLAVHGLGSEKYSLRKPLLVTVENYADEVVARLPDFDIYASAENEADALALLRQDLVDLYEDLRQSEADLGGLPASWLRDLKDYIEERAKLNG